MALTNAEKQARWRLRREALVRSHPEVAERALLRAAEHAGRLSEQERSVLDPYNQCWEARGLYLTDAACFPSLGAHNPTLTILALTARACEHAIRSLR